MDKVYKSSLAAIADIPDGASIMFGGFGRAGLPVSLIYALKQHGAKRLTAIVNNPGFDYEELFANEQIARLISSFPVVPSSFIEEGQTLYSRAQIEAGKVTVELVPQGTSSNVFAPEERGFRPFIRPPGWARRSPRGRKCVSSTALCISWSRPCGRTMP